eukprot:535265-Pelagomonas_calceolata.AAC.7
MEEGSDSMEDDVPSSKGLSGMGMDGMPSLQPGRVVLVVPDMELVEFFRQQVGWIEGVLWLKAPTQDAGLLPDCWREKGVFLECCTGLGEQSALTQSSVDQVL